jgi:hypothetical protein
MVNKYPGLARGTIGRTENSTINVIAGDKIEMGSAVVLLTLIPTTDLLPRVQESAVKGTANYGIAVGGDADGIYSPTGEGTGLAPTLAAGSGGESVNICTQGRCLARVNGATTAIVVGAKLTQSAGSGILQVAVATESVIAIALQPSGTATDIIAVDVQREGKLET